MRLQLEEFRREVLWVSEDRPGDHRGEGASQAGSARERNAGQRSHHSSPVHDGEALVGLEHQRR